MARVLIVDDEPAVVMLMRAILEMSNYDISEAGNGQEALKVLGVDPPDPAAPLPDVILLDVMMPIMDGYTLAVALKNEPRTAKIPVIVVTAKGDMRHLFEEMPSVAAFFGKPFDPKVLKDTVAKIVGS